MRVRRTLAAHRDEAARIKDPRGRSVVRLETSWSVRGVLSTGQRQTWFSSVDAASAASIPLPRQKKLHTDPCRSWRPWTAPDDLAACTILGAGEGNGVVVQGKFQGAARLACVLPLHDIATATAQATVTALHALPTIGLSAALNARQLGAAAGLSGQGHRQMQAPRAPGFERELQVLNIE
jgi:hypothetical protein